MRLTRTSLVTVGLLALTAAGVPVADRSSQGARWTHGFGGPLTDWANRVIELENGTVVAAGFIDRDDSAAEPNWDAMVRKYAAGGTLLWSRRLGGSAVDAAWTVKPLRDGRLALVGFSSSAGAGDNDAWLAMLDASGHLQMQRHFGGAKDDRATDAVVMADGGLLLVGQTESSGTGERDVFVVRTDATGSELWRRAIGGAGVDRGFFGTAAADGGAFVAGVTGVQGNYDFLLMKLTKDGREAWRRVIAGNANDATHGMAMLADGQVLLTGYGPSWGGRGNDVSVMIFSPDGVLQSHQIIGGGGDDRVQFAAADPDGGAWLVGYTKSFSSEWRMLIARVNSARQVEPWLGAVPGAGDVNGSSVTVAANGDLLVSGYRKSGALGQAPDAFVARLDRTAIEQVRDGVTVREAPRRP